jgi:hypothetical protein
MHFGGMGGGMRVGGMGGGARFAACVLHACGIRTGLCARWIPQPLCP